MEQTFSDLCNERKQQAEGGLFGFVLWMFVETAIGIIKEHILLITQGDSMKISSQIQNQRHSSASSSARHSRSPIR